MSETSGTVRPDQGDGAEQQVRNRRQKRRQAARMTDLSTVGLVFPVAMMVGFFGGRLLGSIFGSAEIGGLAGGAFGLLAGFYNVYRTALELRRQDDDQHRDLHSDLHSDLDQTEGDSAGIAPSPGLGASRSSNHSVAEREGELD